MILTLKVYVIVMNNIFELLLNKLNMNLSDLNFGLMLSEDALIEMLDLVHILHYGSYISDVDKNFIKLLDLYEY